MRPNTARDIWRRVDRSVENACWPWTGSTFNGRYGRFFLNGKSIGAHVAAYIAINGEIEAGLYVMHKCNNKLCCNPAHLTAGTNSANQRHASASGAWPAGKSGVRGVTYDLKRHYWVASGYRNGKRRNLYTGPFKARAIAARQAWETENLVSFEGEV